MYVDRGTTVDKDIKFSKFCKAQGFNPQPYQERLFEILDEGTPFRVAMMDPRSQFRAMKILHIEYMQSICSHTWGNVAYASPDSFKVVDGCIICGKRKDD